MRTPVEVKQVAVFLACELAAAVLVAVYIINPCFWPLHNREDCLPYKHPNCTHPPCLSKCCSLGEELLLNGSDECFSVCTPVPAGQNSSFNLQHLPLKADYTSYSIVISYLCDKYWLNNSDEKQRHVIQADGTLLMLKTKEIFDMREYCVDAYLNQNVVRVFRKLVQGDNSTPEQILYPLALGLDLPFLVATAAVYLLLPDLRNLRGRCLLCYLFSLIVASPIMALSKINFLELNTKPLLCKISAFVIQSLCLAGFFWLNVLSFDVWMYLTDLNQQPESRSAKKQRDRKKFRLYCLYAWGGPLLILAITLFMELSPLVPHSTVKPRVEVDGCWFRDNDARVLYFYLPTGVLVLQNIAMFMSTAFRMRGFNTGSNRFRSSESRRTGTSANEMKRSHLYLKLFVLMGINWVMELVSFVVGGDKYIWYFFDFCNILHGLFIFIVFVCKRRILHKLNRKLCPQWQLVEPVSSSARSSDSRTSALTHSSNPEAEGVALKPLPQSAVSGDSDTEM